MPKEYVEDKHAGHDNAEVAAGSAFKVRVGWSKEAEHVEIATISTKLSYEESTPEGNGWFVQLDRSGINRLIRILRRARDDAYGSDA